MNNRSQQYRLGLADAWSNLERDTFLKDHFLPVRQFSEIADGASTYLCGRRGSGKSAIAIKLTETSPYPYTNAIQGEAAQYGTYIDIIRSLAELRESNPEYAIDVQSSIHRIWAWALPVVAMQTVFSHLDGSAKTDSAEFAAIKSYLDSLPSPLHRESTIGQLLSNTFIKAKEHISSNEFDTFLLNLVGTPSFLSAIRALEKLTRNNRALIVLDTLESYKIYAPFMIEGFRGILEAVNGFFTDKRMQGISIKFFLPAEIYEQSFREIPAKVAFGTVFMQWRSSDLIAILAGRFLKVLEETSVLPSETLHQLQEMVRTAYERQDGRQLRSQFWYQFGFLPESILNMLGRSEDCFAYMFRHTFRRPRDVILQFQGIVNRAVESGEFPNLSAESVRAGVHSERTLVSILGDTLSPFEQVVPGEVVANARSVFFTRPRIMTGRELRQFARTLYNLHPSSDINVDEFPETLLRAGVIGYMSDSTALYRKARFEYLMPSTLPLSPNLEYCVHPVLGDLFRMPSAPDGKAIYPLPEQDPWLEETVGI